MKVLFVDDDPMILDALSRLFQGREIKHAMAMSGHQALSICRHHDFDLVISDLNMPGMNGVELARQLRLLYPGLTLFAFTGSLGVDFMTDARGVFDRIFRKPQDSAELLNASAMSLAEKSAVPAA